MDNEYEKKKLGEFLEASKKLSDVFGNIPGASEAIKEYTIALVHLVAAWQSVERGE